MINYREIFNVSYSYIGIILGLVLVILMAIMDGKRSFRIIGYSFFGAGIFMLLVYFLGNVIVDSLSFKFFVNVITNSFFGSVVVFAIFSICLGSISIYVSRYIN